MGVGCGVSEMLCATAVSLGGKEIVQLKVREI